MGAAPGYGSGWSRQGIARHVPPCPAALHLDCPASAKNAPLGIAGIDLLAVEEFGDEGNEQRKQKIKK